MGPLGQRWNATARGTVRGSGDPRTTVAAAVRFDRKPDPRGGTLHPMVRSARRSAVVATRGRQLTPVQARDGRLSRGPMRALLAANSPSGHFTRHPNIVRGQLLQAVLATPLARRVAKNCVLTLAP